MPDVHPLISTRTIVILGFAVAIAIMAFFYLGQSSQPHNFVGINVPAGEGAEPPAADRSVKTEPEPGTPKPQNP